MNESSTKTLTALLVLAGLVTGLLLGLAAITPNGADAQDRGARGGYDGGTPGETTMMLPEETTTMPPPDGGDDEFGEVIIGRGSDTTYNVSLVLASLYNGAPELGVEGINPSRDIVLNAQPEGSSVGIEQLSQFGSASSNRAGSYAKPRDSWRQFVRFDQRKFLFIRIRRVPQGAQPAPGHRLVEREVVAAEHPHVLPRQR